MHKLPKSEKKRSEQPKIATKCPNATTIVPNKPK